MTRYTAQYGRLNLGVCVNNDEAGGIRSELTQVLCPNNPRGVHIGMYDSLQIAKHGRGGDSDAGADEWKRRLDGNHANSNYMSHAARTFGPKRLGVTRRLMEH